MVPKLLHPQDQTSLIIELDEHGEGGSATEFVDAETKENWIGWLEWRPARNRLCILPANITTLPGEPSARPVFSSQLFKTKDLFMTADLPQVGAPDSELKTSPIFDQDDEISLDLEVEAGACYFNDVAYRIGEYVLSGSEILRCEGRGVWMREGEVQP